MVWNYIGIIRTLSKMKFLHQRIEDMDAVITLHLTAPDGRCGFVAKVKTKQNALPVINFILDGFFKATRSPVC